MTILITTVTVAAPESSTWSFQITNTGAQAIDADLWASIDNGGLRVYEKVQRLQPNETQTLPVKFPYAPTIGASQDPTLTFEISPQDSTVMSYSQICTYEAAQNTCQ
jgi:hypothetical protein